MARIDVHETTFFGLPVKLTVEMEYGEPLDVTHTITARDSAAEIDLERLLAAIRDERARRYRPVARGASREGDSPSSSPLGSTAVPFSVAHTEKTRC